ncbi:MAG: type I-MYXAN CRISPR-associated protein Cmx8 [Planctomycetota bacterium]
MAKKTRSQPAAEEVAAIEVRFDLHDLPTAFHKAGLAGMILQIRHMQRLRDAGDPQAPEDAVPEIVELTVSRATMRFTPVSARALHDNLYDADWTESAPRKQPRTKGKGANKVVIPEFKRAQGTETVKKKDRKTGVETREEKTFNGYVYLDPIPLLPYVCANLPQDTKVWLKLWQDAIRTVVRDSKKMAPYKQVASAKRPDLAKFAAGDDEDASDDESPDDSAGQSGDDSQTPAGGGFWPLLLKHHKAAKRNRFAVERLSSALLVGAMGKSAESLPLGGRVDQNLLLHFWPLTTLIFVPQRIEHDGDAKAVGYTLAIPEVADLLRFCRRHPTMLQRLGTDRRGYLPAKAAVDIPAQSALAFMESLAGIADHLTNDAIANHLAGVEAIDYVHVEKVGNNVKTYTSGRVAPDPDMVRRYAAITGEGNRTWGNPIFRSGLLLALLQGKQWYEPMAGPLAERPWEFFCERDGDDKAHRKRLARSFAADAHRMFKDLKDIREAQVTMNKDAPNGGGDARPLDLIVRDVATQYSLRRAEAREGNLLKGEGDKTDWRNPKAQEARAEAARDAFLQLRSRRDQAFIEHFTALFGQFGQYLPEQDFLTLTHALHADTDRVKTITLLALSANGYISGKKPEDGATNTGAN